LKHLSKEALEAAAEPDDLSEWADMQFLLWDAQRRAGISDAEITVAMEDKLKINMERQWPEPKDGEPRLHIKEPGNSPVIPDGLSTVCAEAYQVVGVMADALGVFGDAAVQKVLDNLSQQKLVHRDVLPFSLPVTPDGWVMVPKQVTPEISNAINVVGQRCTCGNCSQRLWDLLLDATQQGVNRG
ncbi:TPA: dATP/dGTP pyrophosphohydrolase domain-containing protein, partial [Escherichia coli]